jgi:hypothetical protein
MAGWEDLYDLPEGSPGSGHHAEERSEQIRRS